LVSNIRSGRLKKIIFIGSTCGLENEGSDSVVYNATKFGLLGVTHALREYLRKDLVSVSCISIGSLASDIHFTEGAGAALEKYSNERIPVADIISIINVILESSVAACIKEIHVPALLDNNV
jgi:short-subunit dehydrogenase